VLLHLQMLRCRRRWRRLLADLGHEKGSISLAGDLGSQRGKEEGPEALQATATFPFSSPVLGGSPASSCRLGKAREMVA
jgi:hypothetical protein